jgi:methionyl-tRNA formyltransferase
MRVIFMGTPDFSVPALEAIATRHDVVAVYSQPPRAAGRGQKERPGPVHAAAARAGIPVFTPRSLKKAGVQDEFAAHAADVAVVAAYGLILPQAILDAPRLGCLNVHASLLPRWRGAAPIQRAIMAGDTQTGITIMQMDAGLDTGPMLMTARAAIDDTTTAGDLHDRLSEIGGKLILEALTSLETGAVSPRPQPDSGITYADKIDKAEAHLTFDRPAHAVLRHIHGLSPYPGAFIVLGGKRLKLLKVQTVDGVSAPPGTLTGDGLAIACRDGAIRATRVQREGKGPMDAEAFLRGFDLPPGTLVG